MTSMRRDLQGLARGAPTWRGAAQRAQQTRQRAGHPRPRLPGGAALDARTAVALQRSAGNAAVVSLVQGQAACPMSVRQRPVGNTPPGRRTFALQRDEDEVPLPPWPGTLRPGGSILPPRVPSESLLDPRFLLKPPGLLGTGTDPDWALFSELIRNRGLVLGEGEAAVIGEHWKRWLPLARALGGIPGVGRFKSPADIMKSLTGSMIDKALAGDHPNALERFNLDDERFGVSTKTLPLWESRF